MMKTIKRITTSLCANFDWAITQIENHEALVTVAMRDIAHAGAKAKVQLARVRRDGERMKAKLAELKSAKNLWEYRAVRCAAVDEGKALECLKRRKKAIAEAADLEVRIGAHEKLDYDLTQDLESIYKRIDELKQKRNSLRSRETTAQALSALQSQDMGLIDELDDVFERWEIKVCAYESADPLPEKSRTLERDFECAEEEASLKAELDLLMKRSAEQKPVDRTDAY